MRANILAFGIAKDIFGSPSIDVELEEGDTANELKILLEEKYPKLKQLASFMIAVNNEYATEGLAIGENDEVAIIPPVSGG